MFYFGGWMGIKGMREGEGEGERKRNRERKREEGGRWGEREGEGEGEGEGRGRGRREGEKKGCRSVTISHSISLLKYSLHLRLFQLVVKDTSTHTLVVARSSVMILNALYIFEICYRLDMNVQLFLHHVLTIIICILGVQRYFYFDIFIYRH
jgi:hypothetical protein